MEFRKVGEELHLVEEHNTPLYIFGEGFIKRYCLRTYGFRDLICLENEDKLPCPGRNDIKAEFLLPALTEFYGEEKAEFITNLVINESGVWDDKVVDPFKFPVGRKFKIMTSDFVKPNEKTYIIEEEIEAETKENGCLCLDKFPRIYSVYNLEEEKYEGEPIISNETVDVYMGKDNLSYKIKSYPVSDEFTISGIKTCFDLFKYGRRATRAELIKKINQCSLQEQFPVLVGHYKSLMKAREYVNVPNNEIVTRWSKYLNLTYPLRKLLLKNKKVNSYRFLKQFLHGSSRDKRKVVLQLGESYIDFLINLPAEWCLRGVMCRITKDNIKMVRDIITHYGSLNSDSVFTYYEEYVNLRKELHKSTPLWPEYNKMVELLQDFRTEKRVLEEQRPFDDQRKELVWEGDDKMFVTVPHCGADLILEGNNLHHCVGGYVYNVKNNFTNIVFIRKKDEPEKSFYTVEINNDHKLVQIRGLQNMDPTDDVKEFLDRYLKQLPPKIETKPL